jgi:transcriptional regulator with XRE-family HTH domain
MKQKPTQPEYKEFASRFCKAMSKAGLDKLTMIEAGERLGVSAGAISYWRRGQRIPSEAMAKKISRRLHCRPKWLLTGGDVSPHAKCANLTDDQKAVIELITEIFEEKNKK